MRRRVVVLAFFLLFAGASWLLAEDITLMTYYPSPRGVYNELHSASMLVGDITATRDEVLHMEQNGVSGGNALNLYIENSNVAGHWVLLGVGDSEAPAVVNLAVGGVPLNINGGAGAGDTYLNAQGGDIGIGTIVPDSFVTMQGPATGNGLHIRAGEADGVDYMLNVTDQDGSVQALYIDASGNVGINTTTPGFRLDVTGTMNVTGKGTFGGGVDPPYISFSDESHESIRAYAEEVVPHEKVMQFWNGTAHRLELYVIAEDHFYTLNGESLD